MLKSALQKRVGQLPWTTRLGAIKQTYLPPSFFLTLFAFYHSFSPYFTPENQQKPTPHNRQSRHHLHSRPLREPVALHTALRLASFKPPIMSDNIPFDAQEMPWTMDLDYDLDQWTDPGLPDLSIPDDFDWSDSMDAFDWSADIPDALGSCNAGPIR